MRRCAHAILLFVLGAPRVCAVLKRQNRDKRAPVTSLLHVVQGLLSPFMLTCAPLLPQIYTQVFLDRRLRDLCCYSQHFITQSRMLENMTSKTGRGNCVAGETLDPSFCAHLVTFCFQCKLSSRYRHSIAVSGFAETVHSRIPGRGSYTAVLVQ